MGSSAMLFPVRALLLGLLHIHCGKSRLLRLSHTCTPALDPRFRSLLRSGGSNSPPSDRLDVQVDRTCENVRTKISVKRQDAEAAAVPVTGAMLASEARVLTEVPWGPLYRVVGYSVRIPCNVSGFMDAESNKKFEFRMQKLSDPNERDINIISTDDPGFAYSVFGDRVSNNEITLEYEAPNSVLFTMTNLLASDEGKYECSVKNEESRYDGVYFAKIILKVIEDTLTVSSPDSTSASVDEGDPLTLTCRASSNTVQHTHLSVTWYLHKDGQENPIVSLDQDLTLIPGPGFEERYRAGAVRLDKVGEATYRLNIAQLEPSDQGRIYCQTREWIQDPDRSWSMIAQKRTEVTSLMVKAKDKVEAPRDRDFLGVTISVQQKTLQEGQELALTCSVDNMAAGQFFSVAWLCNNAELARFGPTGVLQVGAQYRSRQTGGELMATKTGDRVHRLVLRPVRVQDQGAYLCRVWRQDRGPEGGFTQGATQDSSTQAVSISATGSGLSVELGTESVVMESDKLQLTCNVSGVSGRLSVTWEYRSGSTAASSFINVGSLSHEGVMALGQDFAQRSVKATRPADHVFTMELNDVLPSDAGTYQCTVSEWTIKPNGELEKTQSRSQICSVTVRLLDNLLSLKLMSRNTQATVGGEVKLLCRVLGPNVPMTLRWTLRRDGSTSADTIMTMSPGGAITWHRDLQQRYQHEVAMAKDSKDLTLRIMKASPREAGRYQCEASVFLQNTHKKMMLSNELGVRVMKPESQLTLSSPARINPNVNDEVTIKCSVLENYPGSSFAVTWREEENNRIILNSSRDAIITPGAQVAPGDEQRISMLRRAGPIFELTIRQVQIGDSGKYSCVVVEWLQDPNNNWFDLPPAQTTTELHILEQANNLHINQEAYQLVVTEGEDVDLNCTLTSGADEPSLDYPLTWFYMAPDPAITKRFTLAELTLGGLLRGPVNPELRGNLGRRLSLSRPTHDRFQLSIRRAQREDNGIYWCQVEQHQLDIQGRWHQKAVNESGRITLTVKAMESQLALSSPAKINHNVNDEVTIKCSVSKNYPGSRLAITWREEENNRIILNSSRDAIVTSGAQVAPGDEQRISMLRRAGPIFELTIRQVQIQDSGKYSCVVVEWLQDPNNNWFDLPPVKTTTELHILEQANDLHINQEAYQLVVTEGEDVDLNCTLTSGAAEPSLDYPLTWFYMAPDPAITKRFTLAELTLGGLLRGPVNPELRGNLGRRLSLSRPTHDRFQLSIRRAQREDNGIYWCQVEQHQLDIQGRWHQKAVNESGRITLTVKAMESQLALSSPAKINHNVNDEVTIKCSVSKNYPGSRLAITWREEENNRIILNSSRDAIVTSGAQVAPGDEQRISMLRRAGPIFELTIRQVQIQDSGKYSCVVVEWLQDPNNNWFDLPPARTTTELHILEQANNLHVNQEAYQLVVTEGEDVDLNCTLTSGAAEPSLDYPLTWFYMAPDPAITKRFTLAELTLGGLLRGPVNPELRGNLGRRLSLSRPTHDRFQLSIRRAQREDNGIYWCQVEQHQLDFQGRWHQKAVNESGRITLTVKAMDHLPISDSSAIVPGLLTGIILILLVVILVLVHKIWSASHGQRPRSLWTEGSPLESKPTLDMTE
ncbi:Immunoglobulin superfamily member 3 [Merluccius polli]|nr:Immunoglobulin superfamily member 3 [Merluccius polli]